MAEAANRMGHGCSYEIIRAKTLYAKHARKIRRLLGLPTALIPFQPLSLSLKSSTTRISQPW